MECLLNEVTRPNTDVFLGIFWYGLEHDWKNCQAVRQVLQIHSHEILSELSTKLHLKNLQTKYIHPTTIYLIKSTRKFNKASTLY